jgi:opacity protein-like surface antigen
MQTQTMPGILAIATGLVFAFASGVADEIEVVPNLVGEYRLLQAGDAVPKTTVGKMSVFAQTGNRFLIGISERSTNPAENWRGQGILDGSDGYYDWTFSDGKKGRTTFTLDANGNLRGHVLGSGIDWHYVAEKQEQRVEMPQSIEGLYAVSQAEIPHRVVTYLRISGQTNSGFHIGIAVPTGREDQDWAGAGEMHDSVGSYEWACANGTAGMTTVILEQDGSIRGSVRNFVAGEDADWEFIARRVAIGLEVEN